MEMEEPYLRNSRLPLRIVANLHVLARVPWAVLSFPAIAEARGPVHRIEMISGPRCFRRRQGEALHPDRELDGHLNYAAARAAD